MTKAELHAQVDSMTEEEAAEVRLIFAPDWPSKATPIEEIRKLRANQPDAQGYRQLGSAGFD